MTKNFMCLGRSEHLFPPRNRPCKAGANEGFDSLVRKIKYFTLNFHGILISNIETLVLCIFGLLKGRKFGLDRLKPNNNPLLLGLLFEDFFL